MFRFRSVFCCDLTIDIRNSQFCHHFELSSRVPKELIDDAIKSGQIQILDLERRKLSMTAIFDEIARAIEADSSLPLRVCIPSLGSPIWGDMTIQVIFTFQGDLITFTQWIRAHCTFCILLNPLCVNTDMLVLLLVLPRIFQQTLGVGWDGHRSLGGCLMLHSLCRHFQAGLRQSDQSKIDNSNYREPGTFEHVSITSWASPDTYGSFSSHTNCA